MKIKQYRPGDIENNIWCGDIICKCEFVTYLPYGIMIFREISSSPCVRAVFYDVSDDGVVLNGWNAYNTYKELLKSIRREFKNER